MPVPVFVPGVVFLLIAVRGLSDVRLPIWPVMLGGALTVFAAGSMVADTLLILGAASNVIIIQNAEKKTGHTIGFLEFARIGIPLTIVNVLVYWLFLHAW